MFGSVGLVMYSIPRALIKFNVGTHHNGKEDESNERLGDMVALGCLLNRSNHYFKQLAVLKVKCQLCVQ